MLTYLKKAFPIASVALLGLTVNAQKKIDLKFKPENGSKYVMSTTTKSAISQMGMDINMDMQMGMNASISPQGTDKLMTVQYSNITMNMNMMGQQMNLSSNGTDKSSEPFRKLTAKTFGCVLDKNGKIVNVTGIDSLASVFGTSNPASNYFNEDAIKSSISQSFSFYPGHPIAVGESWNTALTITSSVKMKANITYTLEKVENNLAYIKIASTLATDGEQKMTANGMELNMTMGGTQNGEMVVDTKTGMYTSSNLAQDLKGTISAMGQEIPMTIKSDIISACKHQ